MAEITNITAGANASQVIDNINSNFAILKEKVSAWNNSFSYWDMLQIAVVFNTVEDEEESVTLQRFVADVWTGLENYKGVYINSTEFNFQGHLLRKGDYVIKLPGEECLYIAGDTSGYYYPDWDETTNKIIWTYAAPGTTHPDITITIPAMTGVYTYTHTVATAAISGTVTDIRWFYTGGSTAEEIFWNGSATATTAPQNLRNALGTSNIVAYYYKQN